MTHSPDTVLNGQKIHIGTFGGQNEALARAETYCKQYGKGLQHLVIPPSNSSQPGFRQIVQEPQAEKIYADGVIIPRGGAVGIYSKDCPIVVLSALYKPVGVIFHAGKPAMRPNLPDQVDDNVVDTGIATMHCLGVKPEHIEARIMAGICQQCFPHNIKGDAAMLNDFAGKYYNVIGPNGTIDLISVIRQALTKAHVPENQIHHDGICTKENPRYTSHRNGDDMSNLTTAFFW